MAVSLRRLGSQRVASVRPDTNRTRLVTAVGLTCSCRLHLPSMVKSQNVVCLTWTPAWSPAGCACYQLVSTAIDFH